MPFAVIGSALTLPVLFLGMSIAYQELSGKEKIENTADNRVIWLAAIAAGVFVLLGIVCMTIIIMKLIPHHPALTSKKNIDTIIIDTQLPVDFPVDIPVYPGAKVEGYLGVNEKNAGGAIATIFTMDSPEEVRSFYETDLREKGWCVKKNVNDTNITVTFSRGKRSGIINIRPAGTRMELIIKDLQK